jgi:hypothetical protein
MCLRRAIDTESLAHREKIEVTRSGESREADRPEHRWPNDAEYVLFHDVVADCNRFADGSPVGGGRIVDALGAGCAVSSFGAGSAVDAGCSVGADRSVGALSAEWFLLARRTS